MNKPTIILLCALCFILGSEFQKANRESADSVIYEAGIMQGYQESALRANALIKNRHKEFVKKKWNFRATQYGLSVDL